MTIDEIIKDALDRLESCNIYDMKLDVELILAHVLKVDRSFLYAHGDREISYPKFKKFGEMFLRRLDREPLAYILQHKYFMDLDLFVNKYSLIPRPETEVLIEVVIDRLKDVSDKISIADIGTGSGAIAISLANYLPNAEIDAVDILEVTLEVARFNANKNNLSNRINFHLGDLFSPIADKKFNAIVSNPPYIPSDVINTLEPEVVKYEPRIALDGGADGLNFYHRIIEESPKLLSESGFLAVEIGYDQGQSVKQLAGKHFKNVEVIKDLSGNDRVVIANT